MQIATLLSFRELEKIPSQILLNFCVALSLSLIVFLAAVERSKTTSLAGCRAAAIAMHYLLLASFLWMAVEAYNMYLAFVKVFPQSKSSKFILKCSLLAWGKTNNEKKFYNHRDKCNLNFSIINNYS